MNRELRVQTPQAKKQLPLKLPRFLKETGREMPLLKALPSLLQLMPLMAVQTYHHHHRRR